MPIFATSQLSTLVWALCVMLELWLFLKVEVSRSLAWQFMWEFEQNVSAILASKLLITGLLGLWNLVNSRNLTYVLDTADLCHPFAPLPKPNKQFSFLRPFNSHFSRYVIRRDFLIASCRKGKINLNWIWSLKGPFWNSDHMHKEEGLSFWKQEMSAWPTDVRVL